MLTIEMKINGSLIGQIYARCGDGALGRHSYTYHCYMMDPFGKPELIEGKVTHQRQEGFLELAQILYKDINKKRG